MKPHLSSFAVAFITAIALTSTPASAQHRGGHSGGWHNGGGRVSSGGMQRGTHAGAGRHINTGRTVFGRAVPRGRFMAPHVPRHATAFVPSHRRHLSGRGFALGIGVGAFRYPYVHGYYPYGYSYYPYSYSYYPYNYSYPAYSRYSSRDSGRYVSSDHAWLRIVDVPRGAEVYVDDDYASVVDNVDGVSQLLELTPGSHQIEIRAPGFEEMVFEVRAGGGDTITYRARMIPY